MLPFNGYNDFVVGGNSSRFVFVIESSILAKRPSMAT